MVCRPGERCPEGNGLDLFNLAANLSGRAASTNLPDASVNTDAAVETPPAGVPSANDGPGNGPGQRITTPPGFTQQALAATPPPPPQQQAGLAGLDGYVRLEATVNVPGHGQDPRLPIFTYRDPTHYPFRWSPQMNLILGPGRSDNASVSSSMRMSNGTLDLTDSLLNVRGLRFDNVYNDPSIVAWALNHNIHFFPNHLTRNSRGDLDLIGDVTNYLPFADEYTVMPGYADYPSEVLWRTALPYGLNASGALICADGDRAQVTHPFPTLTQLRTQGLPTSLDLATLANIGAEMNAANATGSQCPLPDRMRLNLPDSILRNPLAFVPTLSAYANFNLPGRELSIRSNQNPVLVQFAEAGALVDARVDMRNQPSGDTTNTSLTPSVRADFSVAEVNIGGHIFTLPLSVHENLFGNIRGNLLGDPSQLSGHVTINGQTTLNGDVSYAAEPHVLLGYLERITGPSPVLETVRNALRNFGTLQSAVRAPAPVLITLRRGSQLTYFNTDNATLTYSPTTGARMTGRVEGNLDLAKAEIPLMFLQTGPIKAHLGVEGSGETITANVSAQATLPTGSVISIPTSGSIQASGTVATEVSATLDQNFSPTDWRARSVQGVVRLTDGHYQPAALSVGSAELLFSGAASMHARQMNADLNFQVNAREVTGRVFPNNPNNGTQYHANLGLTGNLGVHDQTFPDGRTVRTISVTHGRLPLDLHLRNLPGLGRLDLQNPAGTDGAVTTFSGATIQPGITLTTNDIGALVGHTADVTVNRVVRGLTINTPMGNYRVSGTLVGRLRMLNISSDPNRPDLRPMVGSLDFELRDVHIDEGSNSLLSGQTIGIRDNGNGVLSVSAPSLVAPLTQVPAAVRQALGIPDQINNALSIPVLRFNPGVIAAVEQNYSGVPASIGSTTERYYNFAELDQVCVPSALLQSTMNRVGAIATSASVCFSGLRSGNMTANYSARARFTDLRFDINKPELGLTGSARLSNGQLSLRGSESGATATIDIPTIRVNTTMQRDGNTYEISGSLLPLSRVATIHVGMDHLNPTQIRIPAREHRFSGSFKVTVRDAHGHVVGRGTVDASTMANVSGVVGLRRSHVSVNVPDIHINGESLTPIRIPVGEAAVTIPGGPRMDLHLEGLRLETTAELGLRRH